MDVLEWNGNILKIPEHNHAIQLEVYEKVTGMLLGLLEGKYQIQDPRVVRIPLRGTAHFGCTFDGEHSFKDVENLKAPVCQYVELDAERFYFNGGKQEKMVLWVSHDDWLKLVKDRSNI